MIFALMMIFASVASSLRIAPTCSIERVEVCQNKHCRKRGAVRTLKILESLSDKVEVADMSHTEHGCFDECTMGPNVRINGEPKTDKGRVINGVKTPQDAASKVLGIDLPDDWELEGA